MATQFDPQSAEWLEAHCKESYLRELERIDKVRDRINFLSGHLILLTTGTFILWDRYVGNFRECHFFWFYVPLSLAAASLVIAIGLVCTALIGFQYAYVPTPDQILGHAGAMDKYLKTTQKDNVQLVEHLREKVTQYYSNAATLNFGKNAFKGNLIIVATRLAIASFVLLVLSMPGYYFTKVEKKGVPTEITIKEPIRLDHDRSK